ncbi:fimbrial biogenesis chaperone [Serratia fonticola]|uniref:fimbrial biogenesis chaperone n=1 Tax=Serratia fonticola TaxID=47917 RepID=UPI000E0F436B|nr:fimbria/pilus periplasmic chaperone [Serratia fonticola]RDL27150.1 P pilus assembly chaperone PapD [Serratia fonticola]
MNKYTLVKMAVAGLILLNAAPAVNAAIALDRTRAIYVGDVSSISLNIENQNKRLPFLAQSWIEDDKHQKISGPLVALPPLQRVEPGERSVVRITKTPAADSLPQDRESLYYFNLREIPPQSEKSNVIQLALQSQIKLFYRPKAIVLPKGENWQEKLVFNKTATGFTVENPTPFYVTLTSIAPKTLKEGGVMLKGFEPFMLAPKSSQTLTLSADYLNSFYVTYVNDYGGHPELNFVCNGSICHSVPDKKK